MGCFVVLLFSDGFSSGVLLVLSCLFYWFVFVFDCFLSFCVNHFMVRLYCFSVFFVSGRVASFLSCSRSLFFIALSRLYNVFFGGLSISFVGLSTGLLSGLIIRV